MGRLLLLRHAESEGNRDGVFTATPDVPLTEAGRAQAHATADWLRRTYAPRRVVTSPFTRARQTAAIVAELSRAPLVVAEDLRERCYGRLAGMPYATPRPDYDRERYWTWRPEGGETLLEVATRIGTVLDLLVAQGPLDDVVVVSHGAAMMAAQWHVTRRWPPAGYVVRNAGVIEIEHAGGSYGEAREIHGAATGPLG